MWSWEDVLAELREAKAVAIHGPNGRQKSIVLRELDEGILWALVAAGQVTL